MSGEHTLTNKLELLKSNLESKKLVIIEKGNSYYVAAKVKDFCELLEMQHSNYVRTYRDYFQHEKYGIRLNIQRIREVSSGELIDSILAFVNKNGNGVANKATDPRRVNNMIKRLDLIKAYPERWFTKTGKHKRKILFKNSIREGVLRSLRDEHSYFLSIRERLFQLK